MIEIACDRLRRYTSFLIRSFKSEKLRARCLLSSFKISCRDTAMPKPLFNPTAWRGRSVLVTGATGFLGGWLIGRLLKYGAHVVALVRRDKADSQFEMAGYATRCQVVRGEAWNPALISDLFETYPLSAIFHTAASADVNKALADPVDNFLSAINSTLYLLEQVRTRNPNCAVVVSSSDKAYGSQPTPFFESAPLLPSHPYEVAKAARI